MQQLACGCDDFCSTDSGCWGSGRWGCGEVDSFFPLLLLPWVFPLGQLQGSSCVAPHRALVCHKALHPGWPLKIGNMRNPSQSRVDAKNVLKPPQWSYEVIYFYMEVYIVNLKALDKWEQIAYLLHLHIKPVLLLLATQNRKLFFKRNPKHTLNCLGFVSFCSYVILCLNNRVEQHATAQLSFAESMWCVTPVLFWHGEAKISPELERIENLPCGLNCLLEFLSVIKLQLVLAYGISDGVCCFPKPTGIMNWRKGL